MKNLPLLALLVVVLGTTAGCSHKGQEMNQRMESVENTAATARLRADEAYNKAEMAMSAAAQAQKTADEANERALRMVEKSTRK
jgi:regulator of protease activity HflC (stomatin/prohibitin superfamily)